MTQTMTLEIKRYLKILLRWWWLIVLGAVLAGGSAYIYTQRQPRFYASRTTLMVGTSIYSAEPNEGQLNLSRTLASIYATLAKQRPVLEGVIERLGLEMSPDQLGGMVNTSVVWNAALLQVTVIDVHPERAQILATAVAEELVAQSPGNQTQLGDQEFIQKQLETLQTRIETADTEIETLKVTLESLTSAADIAEIESRIESWEKIKADYQNSYAQLLDSGSQDTTNTLSIVEPATFSDYPISPNVRLNLLAGAGAGMILMIVTVIVIEFFNDALEWQGEDSQVVKGLPVLGAIPKRVTDDERDLIFARTSLWSAEADAVRSLRTNIFLASGNNNLRTLLVTSTSPGDGKSTTTANLAAVIASSGIKTIIVDGDLRRPRVNELFDKINVAGVSDLLQLGEKEREAKLDSLLLETDIVNLMLLPAGRPPVDPTALLGSKAMTHLLDLLLDRAEYVIIDGTPILVSPDAAILANLADATTVVVGTGQTTRSLLTKALDQLRRFGQANLTGLIFNRINMKQTYQYYSHYHEYGHQMLALWNLEDYEAEPKRKWKGLSIPWLSPPNDADDYVSVKTAAAYLGLTERTVKRWIETDRLPAQKRVWRWWIRRVDIEQFTQNGHDPETFHEMEPGQELIDKLLKEAQTAEVHNSID